MPTLLALNTVLDATNGTGAIYKDLVRVGGAIDLANSGAQGILSTLATDLAGADPAHFAALVPFVTGIYGAAPGTQTASSAFGAVAGIGPGSFGTGQGLLNRRAILSGCCFAWLEALRKDMATYGAAVSIVDLSSYAAYQNALSAYSCLYTPDFATLFWYGYNQGQQLAAASVFAPTGIVMAGFKVTGSGAGVMTPGSYPATSSYTLAPLGVNCGTVTITGANTCSTSGLSGTPNYAIAYVQTSISGGAGSTAVLTVTDTNGNTFTASVSSLAAGALVAFTPTVAGTVMATPSAVTVAGTATGGVVQIVMGGPTLDSYGNNVWPGALPMAQGFAPLKNVELYVTANCSGSGSSAVTVAAPNQTGASENWTGSLSASATVGATVAMSPTTSGDRMYGPPTAITIASGGVTSGSFQVQSAAAERGY